jgi:hypothetical protein
MKEIIPCIRITIEPTMFKIPALKKDKKNNKKHSNSRPRNQTI